MPKFGLCFALLLFTKAAVAHFCKQQPICINFYLDDTIIFALSCKQALVACDFVMSFLRSSFYLLTLANLISPLPNNSLFWVMLEHSSAFSGSDGGQRKGLQQGGRSGMLSSCAGMCVGSLVT